MPSQTNKPINATRSFIDPPPSYSGPSSYSILNGPTTQIDIEERLLVTQTPEYLSLLKRLRLSIFFSTILLGLLVFSMTFAFYTNFENRRLRAESETCNKEAVVPVDTVNATTLLRSKGTDLNSRMCFTGYTPAELILEAASMQQKYAHKDKLWNMPCSETGAFKYPDDVVAEFSYVVLKT